MTTPPFPTPAHTVRSIEDFLAISPVLLGFWPEESIVMMTFGADRPFHARIDLPPLEVHDVELLATLASALAEPAGRHGARAVVLLYHSEDRAAAESAHEALAPALRREGVAVLLALVADRETYADLEDPDSVSQPYDVEGHPFVLDAIVSGRLTHRSRSELVASLDPDPVRVARIAGALDATGLADGGVPTGARAIRAHGEWVEGTVRKAIFSGAAPDDATLARLLWVLQAPQVRDAAWSLISREAAGAHIRLWRAAVRGAPDDLVAEAAALLGWAAWQEGDGALAWVAVERCLAADPEHGLAHDLGLLLQHAVPPEEWEAGFDWTSGLPPEARGA
ncbi:hypothetical protein ASE01_12595 [Nocardioides sp. Root190]|uniref:DUF4192 domain-containing protein n=1 Tax=Nocardioides sp. Root190 TaxID=1736488 RepID=UPI0006F50206|nr:DUF4192 domain-containing protein [Nocardioides sp. Root190]KRB75888.1 hypothetical protein ASE01_12595 [Nocardioides sp. Root190]